MKITWILTDVNEANNILMVLGKLPFEQVDEMIHRLREQTQRQLSPVTAVPDAPPPA